MIEVTQTNKIVNITVEEVTKTANIEIVQEGTGVDGTDGQDGSTPIKGVDYFDGEDGADGYTPIKGIDYFDGIDGNDGQDGDSAYQVAVNNGFVGTEEEWLLSLQGNGSEVDLTGYATETFVLENVPEVDTSLLAVQDGTVLYQKKPTRTNGTITNVGNVVTGTGTSFENPYSLVGAKIIKANGETAIIATITNNTSLTTVLPFATDSVNSAYQLRAKAIEIIDDGDGKIIMYDRVNQRKIFESTDDGHVFVNGARFDKNGYMYTLEVLKTRQYIPDLIYNSSTINPSPGDIGMTVTVNDALNPTYGGTYIGGGSEVCQVIWSGTNWKTR